MISLKNCSPSWIVLSHNTGASGCFASHQNSVRSRGLRSACYEQVVKALGAVGPSNRGTDTGSGSVEPAHRASSGLIPEERRVPARFPAECLVFHWHGETFDLPENATWLAESAGCANQAFQLKHNVIGLQFHLETTAESTRA